MRINWNEPGFDGEELKEIEEVIKTAYVNEGPKTKNLEEEIRRYLGVKHVILTTSATAALFLAIKSDSIIKGVDNFEVIIPNLTMIATATAVEWAGGKPVIVDVEKDRGTINIEEIERKINFKTTAIIPVHILGRAANMDNLQEIASRHNISIIEDAAGALGSKHNGKFLGTFGKVGCFSLQANKIITSGQGGIIVTNDDKYYEIIKRLRDFGRQNNKEFLHEAIGYNLKFNDLSAALGLAQFRRIEGRRKMLISQLEQYEKELQDLEEIKFFPFKEEEIPLWIDVIAKDIGKLIEYLNSFEIYPRKCWPALHKNPPYKNHGTNMNFPNSTFLSENVLWLPNGPAINPEKISFICEKIKDFYKRQRNNNFIKTGNFPGEIEQMKLEKIHEDQRGYIYLVKNLLENNKEFTFLEVKKGFARGGCLHSRDEFFVVVKGKIRYIHGEQEEIVSHGESRKIPAGEPHAFIGIEDSIVSEWGITSDEKALDKKDSRLREQIDKINESKNI